jgi:DNA polymerase elongation subunit (family B)
MERYNEMQQSTPSRLTLDYISKKELGIGKLSTIGHTLYESDPTTYLAYNVVDVMLCVELDRLLHIMDFYIEMAVLTNSNLSDMARVQYIDNLILGFCNGKYVLPTRSEIDSERMSGAMVYVPVPGLHKNVILLDYKGMYPSIMKSLNISPETKDPSGTIVSANGTHFLSSPIGIVPQILFMLQDKRDYYNKLKKEAEKIGDMTAYQEYDLKQFAVKILSNAFYGVSGYKKFRLADRDSGDSITSSGRVLSLGAKEFVESLLDIPYKLQVVLGDTDSLFIEVLDENITYEQIIALGNLLCDKINAYLPIFMKEKFNIQKCYCSIEADAPYYALATLPKKSKSRDETEQSAKKRYAGMKWVAPDKYKFIVKGLEYVKGNTADITKTVQAKLLKSVLSSVPNEEISTYLKDLHTSFFSYQIPIEQYGKPTTIRKDLLDYPSDTPARRAGLYSNATFHKEYAKDSSFMLYYISSGQIDVIALDYQEPIPPSHVIDMQETWNKLVVSPVETILETRNLSWSDIINETHDVPIADDLLDLPSATAPIPIPKPPDIFDIELLL